MKRSLSTSINSLRIDRRHPSERRKRWVLIAPRGAKEVRILLAKAANSEQRQSIGNQTGGRVFLFLQTDNFRSDYQRMHEKGVQFCETPRVESYGTVVVFQDLYGNKWDLLQLK